MAFSISPHLSSDEFRGVSQSPLKTSGCFLPLSMAHVSPKRKIEIHTVLVTEIEFGFTPDILILIILSQNEHQKCVKQTIFLCLTQMGGFYSSRGGKAATLQQQQIFQGSKPPACLQKCALGRKCLPVHKQMQSSEFALDELIHLAQVECFEAGWEEVTN